MDGENKNNEEIDLSGALKDSGRGVKFDEGYSIKGYKIERSYEPETPKIIQWLMKYSGGLIQDEKQASYVLIGFVVVAIIIVLFLIFSGDGPEIPSEREIFRDTPTTPIQ